MVQLPQMTEPQPPESTEVGSYFIANYPPFSVWSPVHVPDALAALDGHRSADAGGSRRPATHVPLGLYIHIPFCRKRCKFCYFRVYTDKNASEVDVYMDALAREVAMYAQRRGLQGRQFEFVYFGGGTPSFLSSQQLLRLIERISEHWTWEAAREVTFECEPGTLKKGKLETIKKIGVTRLSLGVEHFDDEILKINGRAHKSPEIFRAYDWARDVGFRQINIDLIVGMVGESEAKWKETVEKAIAFDPDSVTIYQMEMPHNTVLSREAKRTGRPVPIADWATKRAWTDYAFRQFEAARYEVSSGYTLIKPDLHEGFVYRDALWHGADLIGTGVASFGHFGGVHMQNVDGWEEYIAACRADELPLQRALPITLHQALVREMILQLKTGTLERAYFREKFDVDIGREFAPAFDALAAEGNANFDDGMIRLTRQGLLQVDALLPRFFESEHQGIRYT